MQHKQTNSPVISVKLTGSDIDVLCFPSYTWCTSGQQLNFIFASYCFFEFLWWCLHCNYSNPLARDVEESIHRCLPTWGFFADLILCIQNDNPKKTEPWLANILGKLDLKD